VTEVEVMTRRMLWVFFVLGLASVVAGTRFLGWDSFYVGASSVWTLFMFMGVLVRPNAKA
jgi:hypothetical protein